MKLIALDDGHGMNTGGKRTPLFSDGTFMKENEFNAKVVDYLDVELQRCGFSTLLVAGGSSDGSDVPLATRTGLANNTIKNKYNKQADLFISVHANAHTGSWGTANGLETFVATGLSTTSTTYKYARIIHKWIMKGTQLRDRGIKFGNFHVLTATKMPSFLVELGFMDNLKEAELLKSDEYRKECAKELAQAICEIYEVKYKEVITINSKSERLILSEPSATISQMKEWAKNKKAADWFIEQADNYYAVSKACGVNPIVTYCQSAKETGYGKFGGVLDASYFNPCGMKISAGGGCDDPNAHKRFSNWNEGIQAQVDHLALYAGAKGYPIKDSPDPRHFPYLLGVAKTVESLGGRWAPSKTYGEDIVKMMKELEMTKVREETNQELLHEPSDWAKEAWEWGKSNNITDGTNPKGQITREQVLTLIYRYHTTIR